MAEQLGEAVLKLSVDSTALDAGLQRSRQQAEQTGTAVEQAFTKTGKPLQTAANGLQFFIDANGRARTATGQFVTTAELQAAGLTKLADTAKRAGNSLDALQGPLSGFNGILRNLAGVAGIVGIGALTQQIISTGQESQRSKIQLEALAGAYGEAGQAAQSVQRIQAVLGISALDARQGFAQLYASLRGTGIGLQQLEVLFVGVSNAARLSGASAAEAQGALLQLRQGLASGRLQGDELRSVLENLPALSQAIAKELGVTVGQVKQLGADGKITSDIIFNAAKSLADATVPGRTSIEQLGIAYENLKEKAAEAFGPALLTTINNVAAGVGAFANYLKTNREALTAFAQSIVGIARTLAPLAVGILTVQAAFKAWAIAVQAVRVAQAGLLALQGPKGWAVLAGGIAATALAAKLLGDAYSGVENSVGKARDEADKALEAFKALSGQTNLTPSSQATSPSIKQQGKEAADLRAQQERFRTSRLETANAEDRLRVTQELTRLEEQAALRGTQVSETAKLQLQQQLTISEKLRQQDAARAALATELAKPPAQRDRVVVDDLTDNVRRANQDVRQAYADAGLALVQNARSAADALKSAQQGLNSTLRGGFDFLTPALQQEQLNKARASIQPLVDSGVIRQGIDISSPDKLFQLAGFADSYSGAVKTLEQAINENTAAQKALIDGVSPAETFANLDSTLNSVVDVITDLVGKDWRVNVNVPGGSATGDVVGAINGGL